MKMPRLLKCTAFIWCCLIWSVATATVSHNRTNFNAKTISEEKLRNSKLHLNHFETDNNIILDDSQFGYSASSSYISYFEILKQIRRHICNSMYNLSETESTIYNYVCGAFIHETSHESPYLPESNHRQVRSPKESSYSSYGTPNYHTTILTPHIYPYGDEKGLNKLQHQDKKNDVRYVHLNEAYHYIPPATKHDPPYVEVYPGAFTPSYSYFKVARSYWLFHALKAAYTAWEVAQTLAILYLFWKISVVKLLPGRENVDSGSGSTQLTGSGLVDMVLQALGLATDTLSPKGNLDRRSELDNAAKVDEEESKAKAALDKVKREMRKDKLNNNEDSRSRRSIRNAISDLYNKFIFSNTKSGGSREEEDRARIYKARRLLSPGTLGVLQTNDVYYLSKKKMGAGAGDRRVESNDSLDKRTKGTKLYDEANEIEQFKKLMSTNIEDNFNAPSPSLLIHDDRRSSWLTAIERYRQPSPHSLQQLHVLGSSFKPS